MDSRGREYQEEKNEINENNFGLNHIIVNSVINPGAMKKKKKKKKKKKNG